MLTTSLALVEMKRKNIETIRSLCAVAYTDGNYLGDSWIDVSGRGSGCGLIDMVMFVSGAAVHLSTRASTADRVWSEDTISHTWRAAAEFQGSSSHQQHRLCSHCLRYDRCYGLLKREEFHLE